MRYWGVGNNPNLKGTSNDTFTIDNMSDVGNNPNLKGMTNNRIIK